MPIQLLERPEINAFDPDEPFEDSPPTDLQFRTISDADVQRLNDLFYRTQCAASRAAVPGAALALAGAALSAGGVIAAPPGGGGGGGAAGSIATGVANATSMINAIDGIAMIAFGVALAPLGFMTTLRVLNMVLSRV